MLPSSSWVWGWPTTLKGCSILALTTQPAQHCTARRPAPHRNAQHCWLLPYSGYGDSETAQRMSNCGFTDDETWELLSQGVKPWDPEAWDMMRVLQGGGGFY